MIYIVGLGPGSRDYIITKAIDILEKSDIIVGFSRAIDSLNFINNEKVKVKALQEIVDRILNEDNEKDIAVVASGDPNFYGISDYLNRNLNRKIQIIPGITSFQYLMCKINKSWNNACIGSLHGRSEKFIDKVKMNRVSIWLCDNNNSPSKLCVRLMEENIRCKVTIGENLSYEDERIEEGNPSCFVRNSFSGLSIIVIENLDMGEKDVYKG